MRKSSECEILLTDLVNDMRGYCRDLGFVDRSTHAKCESPGVLLNMSKRTHEYSFLLLLPKKISIVYPTKVCTQHRVYISRASHNTRPRSCIPGREIFDKLRFSRLITARRGIIVRKSILILSDSKSRVFSFQK